MGPAARHKNRGLLRSHRSITPSRRKGSWRPARRRSGGYRVFPAGKRTVLARTPTPDVARAHAPIAALMLGVRSSAGCDLDHRRIAQLPHISARTHPPHGARGGRPANQAIAYRRCTRARSGALISRRSRIGERHGELRTVQLKNHLTKAARLTRIKNGGRAGGVGSLTQQPSTSPMAAIRLC